MFFHSRLLVFVFALLVALATGSPSSGARCKPVSLSELKAMRFWQTFYDRLGIIVWGDAYAFDNLKNEGTYPKLETTFDDGSENAEVCSEGTVVFQPTEVAAPLTGGRTYETAFKVQDVTPPDSIPGTTGGTYTVNAPYPDVEANSFEVDVSHDAKDYTILHELVGDICWIRYENTTCIQDTTGQATFSLYGAVRVGFDSPVNGHYYCILSSPQEYLVLTISTSRDTAVRRLGSTRPARFL
ncbi:hypothetical protein C8F04DRAFT_1186252 [Mycena alexandri]|uniref:Uncharacterized protein n=1 Tax=Mycena alexandri TaxID=1745969 RepID=A0AAD6X3M5_9AGAR|nr:hypothetical protein C8F04DRAFT_1186252 [Mycena alexandri]